MVTIQVRVYITTLRVQRARYVLRQKHFPSESIVHIAGRDPLHEKERDWQAKEFF